MGQRSTKHPIEGVAVSPRAKVYVALKVPGSEALWSSCVCPQVTRKGLLYLKWVLLICYTCYQKGPSVTSSNSCHCLNRHLLHSFLENGDVCACVCEREICDKLLYIFPTPLKRRCLLSGLQNDTHSKYKHNSTSPLLTLAGPGCVHRPGSGSQVGGQQVKRVSASCAQSWC